MKLVSIVLHNYLSHPDTTLELNGTRLAAFVGANGAGKSALLDSLRYVLFDDGRAKTDQLVRLGETDMSAQISFEFAGAFYLVTRGRTSKGAGKSYLELAVQADDGSWTSLSGDDMRDTQAKIQALLGVDADTFGTAVFLGQGEANRFAEATAGERKRILGQVLGLDVYAKAEARARDETRTLEATTAMDRSSLARLTEAIAELEPKVDGRKSIEDQLAEAAAMIALASESRDKATARLTELAGEIAKGDAAAAEVARLEAERSGLAERYRREKAQIAAAAAVLERADDVATAAAVLPEKRAALEALVTAEAADRSRTLEISQRHAAFDPAERELREAHATWTAELRGAEARVTELVAGVDALEPVICRKCGTANVVDQADLSGQLRAARARAAELKAGEPKETMAHSRERVAIKRLEERHAEDTFDRNALVDLQGDVAGLERLAAGAEAIELAKASQADADAELVKIQAAGQAIAERIRIASAATAGTSALVDEQTALQRRLRQIADQIHVLEDERRVAERGLTILEALQARLEELTTERGDVAARLDLADVDLGRLRRLVAAFGVTGIPARIIESTIPELEGYANDLLTQLRPGMSLSIRSQRAKKSGGGVIEALDLVVRDEVGERPLAVFSGGERMSCSLAIAVALSRLVARRAGSSIQTLVIDEPDGLDSEARRSFGQALRILAHEGTLARVILVSHHEDLAEAADEIYRVTKGPRGSMVEVIA